MTKLITEPHTALECANGDIGVELYQIKEMKLEAHMVEDESCLTLAMRDGARILFFGKAEDLRLLAETFATQTETMRVVKVPHLRYAIMPALKVTIDNEEQREAKRKAGELQ